MSFNPGYTWGPSLADYGIYGDGVTKVGAKINAVFAAMPDYSSIFCQPGRFMLEVPVVWPVGKGCTVWSPPSSQVRCGPTCFVASPTSGSLAAIACTTNWLSNGTLQNGKGLVIDGLSFDGNGINDGETDETKLETTSKATHGLVMNGIGYSLLNVFSNSANGYNIYLAGLGANGSSPISESHEVRLNGLGCRWSGLDGFHAESAAMDGWAVQIKTQYSGGHGIFTDDNCPAWQFMLCHPSWAAHDIMHIQNGWGAIVMGCYIGGLGAYRDASGTAIHHGIWSEGSITLLGNTINDYPPQTTLLDTTYGYGIQYATGGPCDISHNKVYADTTFANAHEINEVNIGQKGSSIIGPNRFIRT